MKNRYNRLSYLSILLVSFILMPISNAYSQESLTDIDGNVYRTVTIGDLTWTVENFRSTRFANGDQIQLIRNDSVWASDSRDKSLPAFSYFRNDSSNIQQFGLMYNHYVVSDERAIAPEGWRVANEEDWKKLETAAGMPEADLSRNGWAGADQNVAGKLQVNSTDFWDTNDNVNLTNELGFNWVGGSLRYAFGGFEGEASLKRISSIWSTEEDESNTDNAWRRLVRFDRSDVRRHPVSKATGMSIRLVKDAVTTSIEDLEAIPKTFELDQNYPNPFNPVTTINYTVAQAGQISLKVYDMMGREISVLVDRTASVGNYSVRFDASNLPSGIYLYRLNSNNISITKRMTLLK